MPILSIARSCCCNFCEEKVYPAVCDRLRKEHETARQATVRAILGEQGGLQEDARLAKVEQDGVRACLATTHTHATKDPDPFHLLHEQRRGRWLNCFVDGFYFIFFFNEIYQPWGDECFNFETQLLQEFATSYLCLLNHAGKVLKRTFWLLKLNCFWN